MIAKKIEGSHSDTYNEVMALFYYLKDGPTPTVRRAEMKGGECRAEAIDFLADVEVKAARTLADDPYALGAWWGILRKPENYPTMPVKTRERLGKVFEETRLGPSGDYKSLFFKAVNGR